MRYSPLALPVGMSLALAIFLSGCAEPSKAPVVKQDATEVTPDKPEQPAGTETEPTPPTLDGEENLAIEKELAKTQAGETPTPTEGPTLTPAGDTPAETEKPNTETPETEAVAAKTEPGEIQVDAKLIPRSILFGNPQRARARMSSDGAQLAYLAPVDGVMNLWVTSADKPDEAKPITHDKGRGIRSYFWAYDNKHILYTQDANGDENWHVYCVDTATGDLKDLTPLKKVRAEIEGVSEKFPNEILVGLNDRDAQLHDIYKVNIETGNKELIQKNEGVAGYMTDDDYKVRFAINYLPDASQVLYEPDGSGGWKEFIKIPASDAMTTGPAGFDKTGTHLYFMDSRDRNTSALFSIDLATGDKKLIAENDKADIGGVLTHPTEKTIQAVSFTYTRQEWEILDEAIKKDLDFLATVEDGEALVTERTLDDKFWNVAYVVDDGPVKFYLYDRENQKAKFLFASRDDMAEYKFTKMRPELIESRDGLTLVSYLSLPPGTDSDGDGRPEKPMPLVLNVHGGPWSRDGWGFDSEHQWLTNRGYAVLSVNYRGSTGFGKDFINAANGQWSKKMHDDLLDAVDWAVEQKIAEKDKVCVMGGSYGGYATLVGLTFTPDVFACGVDVVGPSSLVTLLQNAPAYWAPFMPVMKDRVGDYETEEGRELLMALSPLSKVDKISKPLLIGQGANDPRVTQVEADQIVAAMEEKKIPVTYCLFPDEGHGFGRPENSMAFNAVVEAFLAENLGGRYEPIGTDFTGSSITVPAGADDVPGLAAALAAMPKPEVAPEEKPAEEAAPEETPPAAEKPEPGAPAEEKVPNPAEEEKPAVEEKSAE
jgi:dipeptidyl aminopeptidase/acylaminoacyl peptidase